MTDMSNLRQAAQQALAALHNIEWHGSAGAWMLDDCKVQNAIHALRAALAEPVQEPQCNPHPKAPHSFMQNASHTEHRYVCECEGWEPYEAGYQAGMEAALAEQDSDSKHATIAEWQADKQRKALTEEEIHDCFQQKHKDKVTERRMITRAIERAHGIKDA